MLHSNGNNGVVAMVPPINNDYANHLHEELAMFKIEDFATQTYVQFKCHL